MDDNDDCDQYLLYVAENSSTKNFKSFKTNTSYTLYYKRKLYKISIFYATFLLTHVKGIVVTIVMWLGRYTEDVEP